MNIITDPDEVAALRQRARDEFTYALHRAYPDPDDRTRIRAEAELDQWWPGTRE